MSEPKPQVAKEFRQSITPLQASMFANAVAEANVAQGKVGTIAGAILAGHGVEAAVNVRMDWKKPDDPCLLYIVLVDVEGPPEAPEAQP